MLLPWKNFKHISQKHLLGSSKISSSKQGKCFLFWIHSTIVNRCSVCLEDFSAETFCYQFYCNHIFHEACIQIWLEKRNVIKQPLNIIIKKYFRVVRPAEYLLEKRLLKSFLRPRKNKLKSMFLRLLR